jgi:microcystin-dependent protein
MFLKKKLTTVRRAARTVCRNELEGGASSTIKLVRLPSPHEISSVRDRTVTMKRLFPAIFGALCLSTQAFAAGSIPVALAQQSNANGVPLVNCQLYLYVTGTVASPQYAYQDTSLTQVLPWPVTCDTTGRLPMFYLADGSVHVRLTDSAGVVQFDYPSMLVIGPSGGGGGGAGTVDPTTIASTGDIKFRPTGEFLSGWVKLNGQTIGSASSGASGRANADTQNLFVYLWANCPDTHCPVITGRGSTALADFNAAKKLTLPDWRAKTAVGLDDMGTTAAGILQTVNISGSGDTVTTPGGVGGQSTHTQTIAEMAAHNHTATDSGHVHAGGAAAPGNFASVQGGGNPIRAVTSQQPTASAVANISVSTTGSGTAFNVMPPFILGTWYEKL